MLRHNRRIEGMIMAPGKIRKRGCSSSSSSSSVVQNYRFKRALLIGKRGGSNTPVPTWKISSKSPYSISRIPKSPNSKGKQAPVSARKLVATLWQMNEVPSPRMKQVLEDNKNKKEIMRGRGRERTSCSVQSGSFPPHLSDPSHSPVSDRLDRSGTTSHQRRTLATSQRPKLTDHQNNGGFDSGSNANLMEIQPGSRGPTPTGSIVYKTHLKDLSNGLYTSKELLKILKRFWGVEEHNSSSMFVISALWAEIERAHVQVNHLIQERLSGRNEMNCLMKHFAEEMAAWKCKEQERLEVALNPIKRDLEAEKKLRRRAESLNKTLGRELAETKSALLKAMKELDTEKRAREIMEQICDELARGIGEDKAKVEELKKESAKVREEVEKEREMLQLADVLREERVQMKLSEAKYQFEKKNAAVDKLRNELEVFLKTKKAKEKKSRSRNCGSKTDIGIHSSKAKAFDQYQDKEGDKGEEEGEEDTRDVDSGEEDSAESDLHSIELNMDNNSRSYQWNYGNGFPHEYPKRVSVDEEIKGRKSTSEKTRKSISLERRISDGIGWDFSVENFPRLERWL